MGFPDTPYDSATAYVAAYREEVARAWRTLDVRAFARAAEVLEAAISSGRTIYACGNGGSAAISNHLLCDFVKGIQTDTVLRPKVISLAAHLELITAIANDISYDDVFAYQLRSMAQPGDVLFAISASGNSPNIVKAVDWAHANGVVCVAFTGFDGGRCASLADVNLHIAASNYGVVEDIHQSLMHGLAQYLRQKSMSPELITARKF